MADFDLVMNLPDIDFVNTSVSDLLSLAITAYQDKYLELTGTSITVQPGDDVYILLYAEALRQYSILQTINSTARMNFLKYTYGDYADHLAANTGNSRDDPSAAVTTLLFTLASTQSVAVTIPKGTRVTPGNGVYFATDADVTIAAGNTTGSVSATCTTTGTAGNGYISDQLSTIVDALSYPMTVSNTDTTSGGADKQSDLSLKEKIWSSPSGYSVAGPAASYEYFARAYSSAVSDAKAKMTSAGHVTLYVLLKNGALPNQTFLDQLSAYLDPYRPLTDYLTVSAPTTTSYNISLTYYIDTTNSVNATSIQSAVSAAVTEFTNWTKSKIGRDIIPDQLTSRIIAAGAKRVVMTSPSAFTAVADSAIAVVGTVSVTYGGTE